LRQHALDLLREGVAGARPLHPERTQPERRVLADGRRGGARLLPLLLEALDGGDAQDAAVAPRFQGGHAEDGRERLGPRPRRPPPRPAPGRAPQARPRPPRSPRPRRPPRRPRRAGQARRGCPPPEEGGSRPPGRQPPRQRARPREPPPAIASPPTPRRVAEH